MGAVKRYDGAKVLLGDLSYYARALSPQELEKILIEGSDAMVNTIKANISGHSKSGKLEQSIGYGLLRDRRTKSVTLGTDLGWKRLVRPSKGKKKIYTSTYGPILDRSHRRQLRHMKISFDVAGEFVADIMASRARAILDAQGDPF